jgi:THO complex subunit 2
MYDLAPSAAWYDEECAALQTLNRREDSEYIAADHSADRTKRLSAGSHRAKRDRYNAFLNKEQSASRVFTMKRLAQEKHHWFAHSKPPITSNSISVSNIILAEHHSSVLGFYNH